MEKPTLLLLLCFIASISTEARGYDGNGAAKLYIFGDSYADTGNTIPSTACWKEPYGITFPGKPSGRFSDGHVFSDYFAQYLGVEPPVPYNKDKTSTKLDNGVNFAYGGTGVFDTLINEPNMTTQIGFFQQLLDQQKQSGFNLNSSIALVSTSGNDYVAFVQRSVGNILKWKSFSRSLVKQIGTNIVRLQGLGVKKIVVTSMGPVGCYPAFSFLTFYTQCAELFNTISKYHNQLLNETAQQMGIDSNVKVLDMYSAFMSAFKAQNITASGKLKFEQLLKPCCEGDGLENSCGSTDDKGTKKYTLCQNPQQVFFWDKEHPTQYGWNSVFEALKPSLGN